MLNNKRVFDIAQRETPSVEVSVKKGWARHDIVSLLTGSANVGIELGVAKGIYAQRMLESNKFSRFYGVDLYGDFHDTTEYKQALNHIGLHDKRYCLLRMTFDDALDLFPDNFFDFIYIDGFAHTGEEGGKTIVEWFNKLKRGGVLAGDDYHRNWPLVQWAVNDFAHQTNQQVTITAKVEKSTFSQYPSWFVLKESDYPDLSVNKKLYSLAMTEKRRIHRIRNGFLAKVRAYLRKPRSFLIKFLELISAKELARKLLRK